MMMKKPWVAVIIGSKGDKEKIENSKLREIFSWRRVNHQESVFSAHRHQPALRKYCEKILNQGVSLIIAGAGKAAHLPGAIAAITNYSVPVLGVAISSSAHPNAEDAALSIYRMPAGCPVALIGIDSDGFTNAAMVACQIIGGKDDIASQLILERLAKYRETHTDAPEEEYYPNKDKEATDGS